jgi:poly-gamma-glutamate synthesis protein (capsule biosynthesis protein)
LQVGRFSFRFAAFRFIVLLLLFLTSCQPRGVVTLALLGDVMMGRGVTPSEESLAYLMPYLQSADLALANLESPFVAKPGLSPSPSTFQPPNFPNFQPYDLCAPSERAAFLADWGLDLFSIVNNHSLDCGEGSLETTRSILLASGLTPIETQPVYRRVHGLRLAFLALEDISAPLDMEAAVQTIQEAHDSGALVIVSIHWGLEYQGVASERQRQLAQQFVDAGASLIWGHHPHVLQPAEWLGPEPCRSSETLQDSNGCALVLYSLGNALFDQGGLADTRRSALVLVELDVTGVRSVHAIPFVIDVPHNHVETPDEQTGTIILERLGLR